MLYCMKMKHPTPHHKLDLDAPANNQLTVIGWGDTISGKQSNNPANSLMQANLIIESIQKCQNIYQIPPNNIKIGNGVLCATGKAQIPSPDASYGDSGGPIFQTMFSGSDVMVHVLATIQVCLQKTIYF